MDHRSLWQKTCTPLNEFPTLSSDLTCEAAVVGAGLTGVLTAWFLQARGVDVVLLDSGIPGQGVTAHTTAKITVQHGACYADLIAAHGIETAKQYYTANQNALVLYEDLIQSLNINCDFKKVDCCLFAQTDPSLIRSELDAAKALGIPVQFTKNTELPFHVAAAMRLPGQAVFHPTKFLQALLSHLRVYGNTTVKSLNENTVETEHAAVKARHIIITTRYPFFLLPGLFFARMHQERSYACSLSNVPKLSAMYISAEKTGLTFRPWQDQIVLGGFGHRSGCTPEENGYKLLLHSARSWYPDSIVTAQWSAEDCIPADKIPYIGSYSQSNCQIHVATGFQKWGMSSAMAAAQILTDHVCGLKQSCPNVFTPHRFPTAKGVSHILRDGGISAKNLLKQAFYIPRSVLQDVKSGHGGIVQWNGHKTGVFHREDGRFFLVSTRCPHMGCQLAWNQAELSWDCPCHGSRFSYDGTRLDPPAAENLSCRCKKA